MPTNNEMTRLQSRLEAGKPALIAQVSPPANGNADEMRTLARGFAGKVHALGVLDNNRGVRMSALAAASLVAAEGVEPILHVATRDRNRIALDSDRLGAAALGIRNVLCTTGTHQTLGACRSARNVHDIDSVQLMQMYAPAADGPGAGGNGSNGAGAFCVGGVAAPFADPIELQVSRLAKKVRAGAKFLVTQPVFDLVRFAAWWQEVTRRGLDKQVAILAGVRVLTSSQGAAAYAQRRPVPRVPESLLQRLAAKTSPEAQRQEGIQIACETIQSLRAFKGLRGFDLSGEDDCFAALAVIEATGLRTE